MKKNNRVVADLTPKSGNFITRGLGSFVLWSLRWKITGQLPNEKKVILLGAPHTSNWDFVLAMAAIQAVGLKLSYMMKKEAFFFPLGGLFKKMGGIPIDRSKKMDITGQMAEWFNSNDNVWLGITPEGTRSKVETWKKGYLRIAHAANIPVFVIGLNGVTKEIILDRVFYPEGDITEQNDALKAYVDENFTGINPKNQ